MAFCFDFCHYCSYFRLNKTCEAVWRFTYCKCINVSVDVQFIKWSLLGYANLLGTGTDARFILNGLSFDQSVIILLLVSTYHNICKQVHNWLIIGFFLASEVPYCLHPGKVQAE